MSKALVSGDFVFVSFEKAKYLAANLAQPDDIIFTQRGTLGQVSLIPQTPFKKYVVSQSQMKLTVNSTAVSPRYIYHYFTSAEGQRQIFESAIQTGVPHTNLGILRSYKIPFPPTLAEQQSIADALTDADTLIESLEQLLAKKRQIKQGAMQELLTGQRRLPGFNRQWREKPLRELFDFSGGVSASRDQLGSAGHAYLHYGDVHISNKNHVNLATDWPDLPKLDVPLNKVSAGALLNNGDVVFVDASEDDEGTSKHMVVVNPKQLPFISGLHTIVAKPKTDEVTDLYKRYCFQTAAVKEQFRFYAVGTKVSGVSKTNIRKISILLPYPEEQTAIATVLSDMDAEITALEARLSKARHLKRGMAQALLTGRIRLV